ncbi:MAG TPA: HPP family protein [Solimonas sp.]|nr:HPP family protein [Solimonas sp.]
MKGWWWETRHMLGVPEHAVSWRERGVATLTAGLGLAAVALLGSFGAAPHDPGALWLATSIGASAVLVFAVPHGPLSQPWAVIGGQGLSALVGVATVQLFGGGVLAAGVAVAAAIGLMHSLRCIHPPGGATALSAVVSASAGHAPGWDFLWSPVLLDALLIVIAAVLLNAPFHWRRYPVAWAFRRAAVPKGASLAPEAPFTARQLRDALDELDTVIDISDEDLQAVYQALRRQQEHDALEPAALRVGAYYSNGEAGERWAVRRIIDASEPGARRPQLIVKTVAGPGRGDIRTIAVKDFLAWGRYEVIPDGGAWQRRED